MKFRVTPLVAALSASLLMPSLAWANGGAAGANGESPHPDWTVVEQQNRTKHGAAGTTDADANGKDGESITDQPLIEINDGVITGKAGDPGTNGGGGGGGGGVGGGSVFGGISSGGAGGSSSTSFPSANGGAGGNVSGNRIRLSDVTLTGAKGGAGGGGGGGDGTSSYGGAGATGGLGGGSVFGGISSGGAGGSSSSSPYLPTSFSANGGTGGNVSDNRIRLSDVTLTGAEGGDGGGGGGGGGDGTSSYGGAGAAGGVGGGSVFGGISSGGAGGASSSTSFSSNGGAGGNVSGNRIRLSDVTLTGAKGGAGGDGGGSSYGGAAAGGLGGGSVFGGISSGGAGGTSSSANGGAGGNVSGNRIRLSDVTLTGAEGGAGGHSDFGGTGAGGLGGGTVFGGLSSGGAGGYSFRSSTNGGAGGNASDNRIRLSDVTLTGAEGGAGGGGLYGGAEAGGLGGGSVFGGSSSGGAGGSTSSTSSDGGSGGNVSGNHLRLSDVTLSGAKGGAGGTSYDAGAGAGGLGGGSVFGGSSSGGAGGYSLPTSSSANGGAGGNVSGNRIRLSDVTLTGAEGGAGGSVLRAGAGAGAGGLGGGSVFGGISSGGAGGASPPSPYYSSSANGGAGGNVSGNRIHLSDVTLTGAEGGAGGSALRGKAGAGGLGGGSVFGGISSGGAGGASSSSANGGAGGNVSGNHITLAGVSSLTGDIYGGYSRGGAKGNTGDDGEGGFTNHNTVTLVGDALTMGKKDSTGSYESGGSVYGGYSVDGDGTENSDNNFTSYYQGNTLNLDGYRGSVKGIHHFENFNWILPKDVVNGDTFIRIEGGEPVALDHTKHSIAMKDDGNRLNVGDTVTLIDHTQGTPQLTNPTVEQGHFILYDVTLREADGQLVLGIAGKKDETPEPAGRINPKAKSFLEGRSAMLAMTNQGADMVSENGIAAAQNSGNGVGLFITSAGGSSRYKTGSHIDVKDIKFALGVSKGFALHESSTLTVAAFAEYGDGSYTSHNNFGSLGKVRGKGDSNYAGGGVLLHVDGLGSAGSTAINIHVKAGGHISAALRAGRTRNTFDSADMVDAEGVSGRYKSRTNYFSAMVGAGYVLSLDEQQALDVYGRYTWGRLGSDTVHIGKSALDLDASNSSRLRVGTRYSYVNSDAFTVYGGLAFEREFKGSASGEAAGLGIDQPSFKGNTGVMEVGATLKPWASQQALSVDVGVQGYVGKREGVSGSIKLGYAF